jgi:hypothetical protein
MSGEKKLEELDWGKVEPSNIQQGYGTIIQVRDSTIKLDAHNKWFYILVVISLGIVAIATVGGGIYLAHYKQELPGALIAIGTVAVTGLASLFNKHQ